MLVSLPFALPLIAMTFTPPPIDEPAPVPLIAPDAIENPALAVPTIDPPAVAPEQPSPATTPNASFSPPNLPLPTLGGMQFWGDVTHRAGWRIQRHAGTGHHRLLDDRDVRRAWGDRAACEAALTAAIEAHALPRPAGKTVILLHGMIRSGKCFAKLAADLKAAGFATVAVDYPSTRQSLRDSAKMLDEITDRLIRDQDPEHPVSLHFVCHSAGGLVLRSWTELQPEEIRVGRTVMLGVPNGGASMADAIRGMPGLGQTLDFLWGAAAAELSNDPQQTLTALPKPRGEFATIAGCRGTANGYNPLVPGDDDGTVAVSEAHLEGETDHLSVPGAGHSFLMMNPTIRGATVRFLQHGQFSKD
ncbi:MAG: alpha/beta fold hydrolase [Planctomycetota bacterium]